MQQTASTKKMSDAELLRDAPASPQAGPGKAYTPPQIEDFGRIADVTKGNPSGAPGDGFGGSFVV